MNINKNFVEWFARISLFIIYGWFGILKVFDLSPANPLVMELMEKTIPFMTFETFIVLFGLFEVVIGILFLWPKATKFVAILFAIHIFTTFGPLVLVPEATWGALFAPTLEGQYIIKNLALISMVLYLLVNRTSQNRLIDNI